MWLGWRQRHSAGAPRRQPPERLGGREDSVLRPSACAAVPRGGAHSPLTELVHLADDADPLLAAHGAPLRLYSPTKLGYKLTKYLVSMTFTAQRPGGYWEDQGYPWFGGV